MHCVAVEPKILRATPPMRAETKPAVASVIVMQVEVQGTS